MDLKEWMDNGVLTYRDATPEEVNALIHECEHNKPIVFHPPIVIEGRRVRKSRKRVFWLPVDGGKLVCVHAGRQRQVKAITYIRESTGEVDGLRLEIEPWE